MLVVWIVVSQILVLVLQVLVLVVVIVVVVVKIHDAVVMKKTKGMYANDIIL